MFDAIQQTTTTNALELASPTGAPQLSWSGDPEAVANEALSSYYDITPDTEVGEGDQFGLFDLEESAATVGPS